MCKNHVKLPMGALYMEHIDRSGSLSPEFAAIVESAKVEARSLRRLVRHAKD